jgi:hypothetical protein
MGRSKNVNLPTINVDKCNLVDKCRVEVHVCADRKARERKKHKL